MKSDNVLELYMHRVYWEEKGKSDTYFLEIVGRGFFLPPTLDIMVPVGINIVKYFQTWESGRSQKEVMITMETQDGILIRLLILSTSTGRKN